MKLAGKLYFLAVCFFAGIVLARYLKPPPDEPVPHFRPKPRAAETPNDGEEPAMSGRVPTVAPGLGLTGARSSKAVAARGSISAPMVPAAAPAPPREASKATAAWVPEGSGSGSRAGRDSITPADRLALEKAGIPTEEKAAFAAGSSSDWMESMSLRVAGSPRLLGLLFNNGFIADGVMSRAPMRRLCANEDVLAGYLSGQDQPGLRPMNETSAFLKDMLRDGETAHAGLQSELARRLEACPSMHALAGDPPALKKVFAANPDTLTFLSNPTFLSTLASDPDAMGMLQSASSAAVGRASGASTP